MKRALALITAAFVATPALANSDVIAGVIFGTVLGHVINQPRQVIVQPQPQIIYAPAPQQQVIIQRPSIVCPPGLAPFYTQRIDHYGRAYYIFDGCR